MLEEKYLDKNYYIGNGWIFKRVGVGAKANILVNDVSSIFSIQISEARKIVISWLRNKGIDADKIYSLFPNIEAIFKTKNNEYSFDVKDLKIASNAMETIIIGNQKTYSNIDGPEIIMTIESTSIAIEELIPLSTFDNDGFSGAKKFDLIIRMFKEELIEHKYLGCLMTNLNYDIRNITITIKSDYSDYTKVEYSSFLF
jgi:hypothetical protein